MLNVVSKDGNTQEISGGHLLKAITHPRLNVWTHEQTVGYVLQTETVCHISLVRHTNLEYVHLANVQIRNSQ